MVRTLASITFMVIIAIAPALRAQMAEPAALVTLNGILLDVQGRAVTSATIELLNRTGAMVQQATTDTRGRFAFAQVERARIASGELVVSFAGRTVELPPRVRDHLETLIVVAPTDVESIRVTSLAQAGDDEGDDDIAGGGTGGGAGGGGLGGGGLGGGGLGGGGGGGGGGFGPGGLGGAANLGGLASLLGLAGLSYGVANNNDGSNGNDGGDANDTPASPVAP